MRRNNRHEAAGEGSHRLGNKIEIRHEIDNSTEIHETEKKRDKERSQGHLGVPNSKTTSKIHRFDKKYSCNQDHHHSVS